MKYKRSVFYFLFAGLAFVIAASIFYTMATPAYAQCGSQASSCKNCHEVQGQMSVNADGTGWHQSHAFGDFCYICHAGNNQAMDKTAAHEGMVDPLSDVQAACQQCHVADLQERAQVYASVLGVEVGSTSPAPTSDGNTQSMPASADLASNVASNVAPDQGCNQIVVDDPNTLNYAENYDEIVLGRKPVNWGNMILIGMIGLVVVGGGGFVISHEKLVNVKFGDRREVKDDFPADVVEMLPKIAGLKPGARKSLKNILENKKVDKVLDLVDSVISDEEE
jgi:hypothetical protein